MSENLYFDFRNGDKIYKKAEDVLVFKSTVNTNTIELLIAFIKSYDFSKPLYIIIDSKGGNIFDLFMFVEYLRNTYNYDNLNLRAIISDECIDAGFLLGLTFPYRYISKYSKCYLTKNYKNRLWGAYKQETNKYISLDLLHNDNSHNDNFEDAFQTIFKTIVSYIPNKNPLNVENNVKNNFLYNDYSLGISGKKMKRLGVVNEFIVNHYGLH